MNTLAWSASTYIHEKYFIEFLNDVAMHVCQNQRNLNRQESDVCTTLTCILHLVSTYDIFYCIEDCIYATHKCTYHFYCILVDYTLHQLPVHPKSHHKQCCKCYCDISQHDPPERTSLPLIGHHHQSNLYVREIYRYILGTTLLLII